MEGKGRERLRPILTFEGTEDPFVRGPASQHGSRTGSSKFLTGDCTQIGWEVGESKGLGVFPPGLANTNKRWGHGPRETQKK